MVSLNWLAVVFPNVAVLVVSAVLLDLKAIFVEAIKFCT